MAAEPLPAVRCVLYTRKSPKTGLAGHEKEDISLENQEEQLRVWVDREPGWVVSAVREERHVRYQLKARRVLMQTLAECRRGLYDLILVFNPQRWTGDPKHDNWLDVELEEAGVRVRFLHHDPGEGEFAGVIRYMESHASQREQSNIVVRTGDGKRKRLEEGLTLPRPQPYGYLWNHQADPASAPRVKLRYDHLVPSPEQARHVPRIFSLLASGQHSGNAVAALLNAEGIPAWGAGGGTARWCSRWPATRCTRGTMPSTAPGAGWRAGVRGSASWSSPPTPPPGGCAPASTRCSSPRSCSSGRVRRSAPAARSPCARGG